MINLSILTLPKLLLKTAGKLPVSRVNPQNASPAMASGYIFPETSAS